MNAKRSTEIKDCPRLAKLNGGKQAHVRSIELRAECHNFRIDALRVTNRRYGIVSNSAQRDRLIPCEWLAAALPKRHEAAKCGEHARGDILALIQWL